MTPEPRPSQQPATRAAPWDGPPPDALVMAVAYKNGHEIDRWSGPMDWYWALPMHFTGTRQGRAWIWNDKQAAALRLQSPDRRGGGVLASAWAESCGADRLDVLLAPHPDARDGDASGMGQGRSKAEIAFDAMFADMLGIDAAPGGDAAHPADAAGSTTHTADGAGLAQEAAAGSRQGDGVSADGHHQGHAQGSDDPSWTRARGAEIVEHGGRTPDEHGKRDGSAGGTQGGTGHLLGLGLWDGLIDASPAVATAVNAVLIITDASVTGVGQRHLGRVARGMGARALRDELGHEAARVAAARMRRLRRDVTELPAFRQLSRAEQAQALARIREEIEHAFYEKSRDFFRKQAEGSETLATRYAHPGDASTEQLRDLAAQNADAYRKMERAAVENGGLEADALARAHGPDGVHALGDGPEVDALHATGARGAGAVRQAGQALTHRHHVLPREHKAWFQERGFPGDDIDNFCIELPEAEHQALHGGGNWKLARKEWPEGEWSTALMTRLEKRERALGRKLTREEILTITRKQMAEKKLGNLPFLHYKEPR